MRFEKRGPRLEPVCARRSRDDGLLESCLQVVRWALVSGLVGRCFYCCVNGDIGKRQWHV